MISADFKITSKRQITTNTAQLYDWVRDLLLALHQKAPQLAPDLDGWFGGVVTPSDELIPFSNREGITARLERKLESSEFKMFSIALTTVVASKRRPNQIELHYMPEYGSLRLSVYRPTDTLLVAALLGGVADAMEVEFAFVDAWDNDPNPEEPGDKTSYRSSFATFPHRQCLGWMAYVPQVVTEAELALAAHIISAKGGTIIVAVDEPFDLANKEHIKRANQIEMDMSDLGLLPVIDPSF